MTARRRSTTAILREQLLLTAVLTSPSITRAAVAAQVSERTIRRYLRRPTFARRVAEARKAAVASAISSLSGLAGEAFDAVRRALVSGVPNVELKAAMFVLLDASVRGDEHLSGMAELEELKATVQELMEQAKQPAEGQNRDQ